MQKNGKSINGLQRWHCKSCGKYFQREYRYNARKQGTYEKIIDLTLNSSGVRDIGRILKINKNRVVAVKKNAKREPILSNGSRITNANNLEVEIKFGGEMDEFWSFVQNKSNQRWTWYAIERQSGCILAWHNGKRKDKDFLVLWDLLKIFDIDKYHTDNWGTFLSTGTE